MSLPSGVVLSVNSNETYSFSKPAKSQIVLVAGLGVEGDAHAGVNVRHRSRVRADPAQPNLRQVHLIQAELFGEVSEKGYAVEPGNLGENVTTSGLDLLGLPRGTILRFGPPPGSHPSAGAGGSDESSAGVLDAVLAAADAATLDAATAAAAEAVRGVLGRRHGDDPRPAVILTGLRNPCAQINRFQNGLLKEMIGHDENGAVVRKAGAMAVVLRGGPVRAGDPVVAELPPGPFAPLERV